MAKVKSPRTKAKTEKRVLQMPELSGNGNHPTPELESEIRARAYELYEKRGYTDGRPEDDWIRAEREVLARHGQAHTA